MGSPRALGTPFSFERDGRRIAITLPTHETDFQTYTPLEGDYYNALGGGSAGTVDDPKQALGVKIVRVTVDMEGDVSSTDFEPGDSEEEAAAVRRANQLADEAVALAERALSDFLGIVRAERGQSWLGLSSEPVPREGIASIFDLNTGVRLPVGPTHRGGGAMLKDVESALSPTDLTDIVKRVADDDQALVAETLLADAEYLAWGNLRAPDSLRAVLMAAIACEVKIKVNLREKIDPANLPLIDFILENPREVTITAADGLFNKLIRTAQGRSLREADKDLFRSVVRLFEVRNGVAHRGEWPDVEEARDLVRAARRTFRWLDESGRRRNGS